MFVKFSDELKYQSSRSFSSTPFTALQNFVKSLFSYEPPDGTISFYQRVLNQMNYNPKLLLQLSLLKAFSRNHVSLLHYASVFNFTKQFYQRRLILLCLTLGSHRYHPMFEPSTSTSINSLSPSINYSPIQLMQSPGTLGIVTQTIPTVSLAVEIKANLISQNVKNIFVSVNRCYLETF